MTRATQTIPSLIRRFTLRRGSAFFIWSALLAGLVIPGQPAEAAIEGLKAPVFSSPATFFQQSFRRSNLSLTPVLAGPQAQKLTPETAGTNPPLIISGYRVSYNPINPGPLPEKVAVTFRSATYEAIKLDQPTTLYRVYSDPAKKIGPGEQRILGWGDYVSCVHDDP